jgi:hypothetical protein
LQYKRIYKALDNFTNHYYNRLEAFIDTIMASLPVELPLSDAAKGAAALKTAKLGTTITEGPHSGEKTTWSPSCK